MSLLAGLMIGLAAAKSHAPFLFLLAGAILGALALSIALSHWMVQPIRLRRNLPDRLWQHRPVHVAYYLRNTRRRGTCLAVRVGELDTPNVQAVGGFCVQLRPRRLFRARGRFVPGARGRVDLPGVEISTDFPFGLVRTTGRIHQADEAIVWPARGRLIRPLLRRGAAESSRSAPSENKGGQDEFFGLREYRTGDDPRWIAWRRSVHDKLVVREMTRPRPDRLWLLVDTEADHYSQPERFEAALRFATTLLDYALSRGYQAGLTVGATNGPVIIEPSRGIGQLRSLLDAIALAETTGTGSWSRVLEALSSRQLAGAQCILLTAGPGRGAAAGALAAASQQVQTIDAAALCDVFADAQIPENDQEAA
jgi:uncharacterized protein (DUF58 family)